MIDLFRTHASNRSSGTVLLSFENMSIGKVYFSAGVAISARYLDKEGQQAIIAMQSLEPRSSVFHPNIDAVNSSVPVPAIAKNNQDKPVSIQPARKVEAAVQPDSDKPTLQSLTSIQKEGIANSLAHYIGPVAHLMVAQLDPKAGVSDTIATFVSNIADPQEAKEFTQAVESILNKKA